MISADEFEVLKGRLSEQSSLYIDAFPQRWRREAPHSLPHSPCSSDTINLLSSYTHPELPPNAGASRCA